MNFTASCDELVTKLLSWSVQYQKQKKGEDKEMKLKECFN